MAKSVTKTAREIARGEQSSRSIVESCLSAIKTKNSTLNAFSDIYEDEALSLAEERDAERKKGELRGSLHGVPVGVKDLFYIKDRRTARGSAAFSEFVPSETAPIVERLEAAGAIVIGKTTTTEMGWSGSSVSEYYGSTRNPWNAQLTSGGSSSGSASALVSGMVPMTLGSDGGGSVRIPAAFCGHFALKGSLARIPTYPWSATEMLSHAGPMTLTATDSALLFDILKGPDPRDHHALPDDGLCYCGAEVDMARLRVAYAPTLFGVDVDDEVDRVIRRAVQRLKDAFGIAVEAVSPDWVDPIKIFETLWVAGRGVAYGKKANGAGSSFGSGFANLVRQSCRIDLEDYLDATKARAVYAAGVHHFFERFDILLTPTIPILPFDAELEAPEGMGSNSDVLPWTGWTPFTYPFNITGNPAASIPAGLSSTGMPVGLQVIGRRHSDATVLAFCRDLEEKAGFFVMKGDLPELVEAVE
ncbi:amidase [Hoeflea prorocentri]|uniref:Amidase family protein n=1 Tax=Hoeflea prorocentri TaxID=1922333 RepID=A0A9X3ZGC9_9HYPH|nr:amidase family protein [Hoeflea prorocentri]MCY6379605.1 amidase family protein [Hoeflea prorocentri]MDA5397405.1 amidase family protein [Hoeflea prorocentri]